METARVDANSIASLRLRFTVFTLLHLRAKQQILLQSCYLGLLIKKPSTPATTAVATARAARESTEVKPPSPEFDELEDNESVVELFDRERVVVELED